MEEKWNNKRQMEQKKGNGTIKGKWNNKREIEQQKGNWTIKGIRAQKLELPKQTLNANKMDSNYCQVPGIVASGPTSSHLLH